jgi:hypothetical protein
LLFEVLQGAANFREPTIIPYHGTVVCWRRYTLHSTPELNTDGQYVLFVDTLNSFTP